MTFLQQASREANYLDFFRLRGDHVTCEIGVDARARHTAPDPIPSRARR